MENAYKKMDYSAQYEFSAIKPKSQNNLAQQRPKAGHKSGYDKVLDQLKNNGEKVDQIQAQERAQFKVLMQQKSMLTNQVDPHVKKGSMKNYFKNSKKVPVSNGKGVPPSKQQKMQILEQQQLVQKKII